MRTNRKRLAEWIVDLLADYDDEYERNSEDNLEDADRWAGYIYDDINKGIIAPEESDPVDENGRRTGKASFYGDK